jgi:hypothetical protein
VSDRQDKEPTQLDRIEAKLDQLLAPRVPLTSNIDPAEIRREWTKSDRQRHQRLFLLPEPPQDKPSRLKTAAVIAAVILGFAAVAAGSWWLWGVFIRMHS